MDDRLTEAFLLAGGPTFLKVNLDTMLANMSVVKSYIGNNTEIMAVVKGNAYGHGSIQVSLFLEKHGITCFAVANTVEGQELREGGVSADIIVLNPTQDQEIQRLFDNRLIPTVADLHFLERWSQFVHSKRDEFSGSNLRAGEVVINVDTGMTTCGCSRQQLPELLQYCEDNTVPLHSIMTHLVDSWSDLQFTRKQLDIFLETVKTYRVAGVKVHVANTCAVYNKIGVDLDFVRIGVALYGQPLDSSMASAKLSADIGLKPVLSWYAAAGRIIDLKPGKAVGYCTNYKCKEQEKMAVIPVGYGDGYSKCLCKASVTTLDGKVCRSIGVIAMDSFAVSLPADYKNEKVFCIMKDDYNDVTSAAALGLIAGTSTTETCVRLQKRLPRIYLYNGCIYK